MKNLSFTELRAMRILCKEEEAYYETEFNLSPRKELRELKEKWAYRASLIHNAIEQKLTDYFEES